MVFAMVFATVLTTIFFMALFYLWTHPDKVKNQNALNISFYGLLGAFVVLAIFGFIVAGVKVESKLSAAIVGEAVCLLSLGASLFFMWKGVTASAADAGGADRLARMAERRRKREEAKPASGEAAAAGKEDAVESGDAKEKQTGAEAE